MANLRARPLIIALFVLLLSAGLILLDNQGLLLPLERFAVQFIAPLQEGASRVVRGVRSIPVGFASAQRLRQENQELRAEVDILRSLVITLHETEDENRSLREQLGFSQENRSYDLLPAQVIGRDPDSFVQTIVINRGTRDGVREGKVVVAAGHITSTVVNPAQTPAYERMVVQGLVGRVTEAGPNYARILLISDLSSSINVYTQGAHTEGMLEGQGRGGMMLTYVRQGEQLAANDVLLTSGLGGGFPRSLAVGVVTKVETRDQATFQTATVAPLVDLARVDVVYVIRSFDPITVGS